MKNQLESIFTQDNLHLSLISRKKSALYRRNFLKHPHFTKNLLAFPVADFAIFQTNTSLISLKILTFTLHRKIFRIIHLLPHFHYFQQYLKCVIFQINTDLLVYQLKKSFYAEILHSSLVSQKIALSIVEVSRIIHFLLVFTVGELYHISNKC